jgi:alpha-1,3-rhamnosyl/mannosyltransferase
LLWRHDGHPVTQGDESFQDAQAPRLDAAEARRIILRDQGESHRLARLIARLAQPVSGEARTLYSARVRSVILIDATSLRSSAGLRGIGRYVFDLLQGLAALRARWSSTLELRALARFRLSSDLAVSSDLSAVAEEGMAARASLGGSLPHLRRWLLAPLVARQRASLLHLPAPFGTPLGLAIPRVTTCHDLIPLLRPREYLSLTSGGRPARWLTDLRRYRGARRVVAISERTRRDLVEQLAVPADRIDVVHNGIDLVRYRGSPGGAEARLARLGVRAPYALFVGYVEPRKNLTTALAALSRVRRRVPMELVVAGAQDAAASQALRSMAEAHGVRGAVRTLGFVEDEDLPALYQGAVALLFLSEIEGFGLPVAEAMASGCPALVARDSACDEVAGDAGIVLDARDAEGAAATLVRLASDPEERARWAALGARRVQELSRERMAEGYLRSYERALGGRGAHP